MAEAVSIEPVGARDLPGIRGDLEGLLLDVVNGGGTVGFLPPLSAGGAAAFWDGVEEALEGGGRRLLVARRGGRVFGTVQLDLAMQTNGRHRAEVMKLLVHEEARRRGLGRRLMEAVEGVARDEGRTLLVLDTRQGEPSEVFYAALGTGARASSRTSPRAPTARCTRRSCSTRSFEAEQPAPATLLATAPPPSLPLVTHCCTSPLHA